MMFPSFSTPGATSVSLPLFRSALAVGHAGNLNN